jgi:hypothetical protein
MMSLFQLQLLTIICATLLQAEFELDRKQRMEREERMVKQLTDHEHHTAETFEKQIVSNKSSTS